MSQAKHIPVLLEATLTALRVRGGGRYVDGTLGRAGHARAILSAGGRVLGIDRDEQALREVAELGLVGLDAVYGRHGDLEALAHAKGWKEVDGILLDLGVSSPQLDEAGRGFSFQREGPLDMRMDRSRGLSAAEIVNTASEGDLAEVFRTLGEEPQARRAARAIVAWRGKRAFATTTELADCVSRALGRTGAHHPATRVFQALRMQVNDEMGELLRALAGGIGLLAPGGRFAVITFESLTDRVVKRFFAAHAGKMRALQQGGEVWEGELPRVSVITRKPVMATDEEIAVNPRSRSAKLRVIEKI